MAEHKESLKNKTIKGSFWSLADNVFVLGVRFIIGLVLARLLTPDEYGLIGIVTIFLSVFDYIVDGGLSNALIRKKDATDIDYNTVFYSNLILSSFLFLIFYISSPFIADFFNQPELIPISQVLSIVIIINGFTIIQKTLLTKRIDFKTQTKISIISSVTSGILGIVSAFFGFGVWALVLQTLSASFLRCIFLWFWGHWKPRMVFSVKSFRELFGFGWKLLVSGLIEIIWRDTYKIVIGKCYAPALLGQYSRAQQFAALASSNLNTVVSRVTYPVLSSIQDDKERLKDAYRRIIRLTMLITFVLMLGMAAVARPMILVLVGEQWLPSVEFLQIICFSCMMFPLHAINLNMLKVQGRSDLFLKLELIKKFIALGPIFIGIFINIYWMLIGSVFTGLFAYYLNAYYSGPFLNYSIWQQIKDILPSFGVSLTMALIVYAMSFLPIPVLPLFILQVIVGILLTIGLCTVFKLQEYEELKNIVLSFINKKKKNG